MKKLLSITLAAAFSLWLTASAALALSVPERLVYEVNWSGMKVGKAVHEITPQDQDLRLLYTVRSSGWFNTFYPIDDMMESVVPKVPEGTPAPMPRYFREKINAGKTHTSKEARFDPAGLKVETRDFLKNTEKTDAITARTYDNLSSIFFIRSSDLAPGKTIQIEVYDCKRLWNAEVHAVRREEIRTPLGRFKTVVVTTTLRAEGAKPRPDYMTVWISDDELRVPVKIAIKLKLGEFRAILAAGSYWP